VCTAPSAGIDPQRSNHISIYIHKRYAFVRKHINLSRLLNAPGRWSVMRIFDSKIDQSESWKKVDNYAINVEIAHIAAVFSQAPSLSYGRLCVCNYSRILTSSTPWGAGVFSSLRECRVERLSLFVTWNCIGDLWESADCESSRIAKLFEKCASFAFLGSCK
jgi:hypothetical protein